jgi:Tol biopolymer transport system component
VFRAEIGAQTQVMAAPLFGGAATKLPAIASGAHMSFSPDGTLILDVRGHRSLWVHPLDGRPAYQVFEFSDPDVRIDYPVWSPDGRWILFDRAAPRSGDIWMLEGVR